jgi:tol-pal system protein YbgF
VPGLPNCKIRQNRYKSDAETGRVSAANKTRMIDRHPFIRLAFALAVTAATAVAGWAGAYAQGNETAALHDSLERLRKDLIDLQRFVYRGGPPASAAGTAAQPVAGEPDSRAADALIRVSALETELRDLTGRIEEIRHVVDVVERRLDKLVADIDFRFAALERAARNRAGSSTGTAAAEPAPAPRADAVPPAETRVPGVLGTLPVSELPKQEARVAAIAPPARKTVLPEGSPKDQYDHALKLLREGLTRPEALQTAEAAFTEFLDVHPSDPLSENARYWLGETFYVRQDFARAASAFLDAYQKQSEGAKAPDNLLKLGMSLARLGKVDEACATLQELRDRHRDAADRLRSRIDQEWQAAGCR